jgi:hypothetical protein
MTKLTKTRSQLFAEPGGDPVEAWALRLSQARLSLTAKCIGSLIGWHAFMHGTKLRWCRDFWGAANLKVGEQKRTCDALHELERAGFIKLTRGRQVPVLERGAASEGSIVGFEVKIDGGR